MLIFLNTKKERNGTYSVVASCWFATAKAGGYGYDKEGKALEELLKKINGDERGGFKFEGRLPDGMAGVEVLTAALKEQGWVLKSVGCNEERDIWGYELCIA